MYCAQYAVIFLYIIGKIILIQILWCKTSRFTTWQIQVRVFQALLNFHPLGVVSRVRYPQLQENYSYLLNFGSNISKS